MTQLGTNQHKLLLSMAKRERSPLTPAVHAKALERLVAQGYVFRIPAGSSRRQYQLSNAAYIALGYTPEQMLIAAQASMLLDTLADAVPSSTIHFAVEDARRALTALLSRPFITTTDAKGAIPAGAWGGPKGV